MHQDPFRGNLPYVGHYYHWPAWLELTPLILWNRQFVRPKDLLLCYGILMELRRGNPWNCCSSMPHSCQDWRNPIGHMQTEFRAVLRRFVFRFCQDVPAWILVVKPTVDCQKARVGVECFPQSNTILLQKLLANIYQIIPLQVLANIYQIIPLQVWLDVKLQDNGTVDLRADSDSQITKGLCSVLVKSLSGLTPEEVFQVL